MITDKNFSGRNGFIWYTGVVEDRQDPQYLGRVRVRCIGIHTDDKVELPTADLPWAQCVMPVIGASISGLGHSPAFLVEGSWVFVTLEMVRQCKSQLYWVLYLADHMNWQMQTKAFTTLTVYIQSTKMK